MDRELAVGAKRLMPAISPTRLAAVKAAMPSLSATSCSILFWSRLTRLLAPPLRNVPSRIFEAHPVDGCHGPSVLGFRSSDRMNLWLPWFHIWSTLPSRRRWVLPEPQYQFDEIWSWRSSR